MQTLAPRLATLANPALHEVSSMQTRWRGAARQRPWYSSCRQRSVVLAWPNFRRLEPKCNSKMTRQSKYRIMSEVLTSMVIV